MTLTLEGTRGGAEQAFGVTIADYRSGEKAFHAPDKSPSIPAEVAPHVGEAPDALLAAATGEDLSEAAWGAGSEAI